jgi:GT2 family glycosyltransferase
MKNNGYVRIPIPVPAAMDKPLASILICTRNRPRMLKRSVDAVFAQTLPPEAYEVMVVDDGSSPDSLSELARLQERHPALRVVYLGRHCRLHMARNAGVTEAVSEYLLFTDDDCVPDRDWVEALLKALETHPIVAGAVVSPTVPFWTYCHNLAQFHEFFPSRPAGPTTLLAGANFGIRKATLAAVGGFYLRYETGEDMELALRARSAGIPVWFSPQARVTHLHDRYGLPTLLRYAFKHARSTIRMRQYYRALLRTPLVLRSRFWLTLAAPLIAGGATARAAARVSRAAHVPAALGVVYLLKMAWCAGALSGLRQHIAEESI